MTPTREQLLSIEWAIQDEDGDLWCPSCRSHADVGHRPDCWLAAALSAASSRPQAAPARGECPTCGGVWPCGRCTTGAVNLDALKARLEAAALAPQEAAPMPPIEPGDWVHEDGEKEAVIVRETHQAKSLNRGIRRSGITEIRKKNGTVWRRP